MHKGKRIDRDYRMNHGKIDITWGLTWDLKCILRFLVDSNGTTITSYRGRTIRIS